MILELSKFLSEVIHPLGEQAVIRWSAFGVLALLLVVLPLLLRRREGKGREGHSLFRTVSPTLWIPLMALALVAAMSMLVIPFLPWAYPDSDGPVRALEWKVFNPFDDTTPTNRIVLSLLVIPIVVGVPLAQYFLMRREVRGPLRLMMAGLRMMVLWIVFIVFCAPYTSITPERQVPWRTVVAIDASTSMTHRADALSPFRELSVPSEVARDDKIAELIQKDAAESQALREYLVNQLRMPLRVESAGRVSVANPTEALFHQRAFVRKVVQHRATRLQRKFELLRASSPNLETLAQKQEDLRKADIDLKLIQSDIAIERTKSRSDELPRLQRKEEEAKEKIAEREKEIDALLVGGDVFAYLDAEASKVNEGTNSAEAVQELRDRFARAMRNLTENLASTIHLDGPTRWDISCELVMPGFAPSRDENASSMPLSVGAEAKSLIDEIRRNSVAQADRLPDDIAKLVIGAAQKPSTEYGQILSRLKSVGAVPSDISEISAKREGELLTLYLFSAPDFGAQSSRSTQQTNLEELDFLLPKGPMTKLFFSYASIIRKEANDEVANVLVLSDGVDTSNDVEEQIREALNLRDALEGNQNAPRIMSAVVGYSSQGKILELAKVKAPDSVLLDDLVQVELSVKANHDWEGVEVILERVTGLDDNLELEYDSLNDIAGQTKIDVKRPGQSSGTYLNFVNLSFTPEVNEDDDSAKRDLLGRRYWEIELLFRLNREARPGEMTYDNNYLTKKIIVRENKIRVLYIDQRFRYETRYLVEAMARDKTLEMHSFIYEADEQWPQRTSEYSTKVMRRMPPLVLPFCTVQNEGQSNARTTAAATFDDWMKTDYHVVILGDVHAQALGIREREWLARFVRERKGGLIFLAGLYNMPWSYTGDDLADMIPVKLPQSSDERKLDTSEQYFYGVTPVGFSSQILELSFDRTRQRELWGGVTKDNTFNRGELDGFYWYAKTAGPKDSSCMVFARVAQQGTRLNFAFDSDTPSDALIVGREEEEGRTLFMGTDEFWRMRRYFGDFYTYRIWQNAIRWAAARRLDIASNDFEIYTDQRSYQLGREVHAFCDFVGDETIIEQVRRAQEKKRRELGIEESEGPILLEWKLISSPIEDIDRSNRSDILALKAGHSPRRFEDKFVPSLPGEYQLTLVNDSYKERQPWFFRVEASTEAEREKDEMSQILPDNMKLLASVNVDQTGGGEEGESEKARWFTSFEGIAKLTPKQENTTVYEGTETFKAWNLLQILIVLACLLGVEWFVRKLVRLA